MAETLVTSPEARDYLVESGFHQVSYAQQDLQSPQDEAWLQISPTWGYDFTTMDDLLSDADHISAAQQDARQHTWASGPQERPATYDTMPISPAPTGFDYHDSAVSEQQSSESSGKTLELSESTEPPLTRRGHRASAMRLLTTAASHVTKAFTARRPRLDAADHEGQGSSDPSSLKIDTSLDNDTETLASWDASNAPAEPEPTWLYHFRAGVAALSTVPGNGAFITPELDLEQRIRAHAIAALWGLSHMSVGKGRVKRLIIANCPISPFCGNGGQCLRVETTEDPSTPGQQDQRQAHHQSSRRDGIHMDVTRICFHVDSRDDASCLLEVLHSQECIPAPLHSMGTPTVSHQGEKLVTVSCADVKASSAIVERLSGVNQFGPVRLLHVHFPFMKGDKSICGQLGTSQATIHGLDQIWRPPASSNPMETREASPEQRKSRKRSRGQPPMVIGEDPPLRRVPSSAASSMHSNNSMSSSIASTTRKFRQPKIKNGYQCPDCVRMFDRAAERDKHWKNVHQRDRPYQCPSCAMAFLYPKDLERHLPVHSEG